MKLNYNLRKLCFLLLKLDIIGRRLQDEIENIGEEKHLCVLEYSHKQFVQNINLQ